jgi:hypothetical protein
VAQFEAWADDAFYVKVTAQAVDGSIQFDDLRSFVVWAGCKVGPGVLPSVVMVEAAGETPTLGAWIEQERVRKLLPRPIKLVVKRQGMGGTFVEV